MDSDGIFPRDHCQCAEFNSEWMLMENDFSFSSRARDDFEILFIIALQFFEKEFLGFPSREILFFWKKPKLAAGVERYEKIQLSAMGAMLIFTWNFVNAQSLYIDVGPDTERFLSGLVVAIKLSCKQSRHF